MVQFGEIGYIWASWFYLGIWFYLEKRGFICAKVIVFGQICFFFEQSWLYLGETDVFG